MFLTNLLEEGKHASLRDVFYMVKRTIPNTKINLVDEQTETDKAIEDLELITEFSREQLDITPGRFELDIDRAMGAWFWDKRKVKSEISCKQ